MKTINKCPECGKGTMVQKNGKYGAFFACDQYPKCRYTEHMTEEEQKEAVEPSNNEFHLSPEQTRSNAFELALKWRETLKEKEKTEIDVFYAAELIETWLLRGEKPAAKK